MATIVTRAGKGSPLTNTEVDANFTNLNTDKIETVPVASASTSGTVKIGAGVSINAAGVLTSTGATNLSNTPAATNVAVESSTGTNTTLPAATTSAAGVLSAADKTKLDGGAASGLHADLLDGQHGSYYTGYADTAVSNLVDSSPAALNTLNELAAALGDDANFSTTITDSVATKLPKAGGAMTGAITTNSTFDGRDVATDGTKLDTIATSANNYAHPTGNGNQHIPADGAAGKYLKYASAGTAQWGDNELAVTNFEYTATANQTAFSGSDNNSATLAYTVGGVIVSLNGIILDSGSDYTASNGTLITLATGAAVGDHFAVIAFSPFSTSDTVSATSGGTFGASVTVNGNVTTNGNIVVTGTVDGRDLQTDGTKLDGVATSANNYVHPTTNGNKHVPAGGATGQVLTYASAGTAQWVAASGGGEQTFTASGSISAGNIVGINSSGTVEVMQQELSGVSQLGTATPYMPEYNPIAADTDGNGKVLVVVTVSDGRPLAYVGTVSGTTISFGSAVEVTTATNQLNASVTYDANAGKFLVFWYDHNGTYSNKAAVGTISGTTVSFGSIITVASSSKQGQVLYNPDTQSSLILYLNNSGVLYAKVATISGTSVSVGSALTVESGSNNRYPRLSYDTTANKYVAAYKYNNAGTAKVLTVSGTSVTAGSRATFDSNTVNWIGTAYNPTANRHIMQYYVGGPVKVVAGTISGTSITFGTPVALPVSLLSSPYYNSVTQQTILTGQSYNLYYILIHGSGNAITIGETTQWLFDTIHTSPSGAGPRLVNLNSTRNFWVFSHGSKVQTQVTNEAVAKFVGLAKENISNGATGKVTVMGGINTSVSSLTAGKSYGLPTTAAVITEITDQGSTKIFGTALSATSIYIDKGNLR